jgi:hypothetical protein
VLLACGGVASAGTQPKTGQSPSCRGFCIKVEPREGPEGTVFRFVGSHWRANRRVRVTYGVHCPPGQACIDIAYLAVARTNERGRFVFRLREGAEQEGDEEQGIHAGGNPIFSQRRKNGRFVTRTPDYSVIYPEP